MIAIRWGLLDLVRELESELGCWGEKLIKSIICWRNGLGTKGAILPGALVTTVEPTQEGDCVDSSHRLEYQWVENAYALQACESEALTLSPSTKSVTEMRFYVDANEEHIRLHVVYGCKVFHFDESALFVVLLRLARKKLEDMTAKKLPSEQGWLHTADFLDDSLEEEALNVTIFRLRKLFQRRGIENAWNIVERRRKQLRIAVERIELNSAAQNA